MKLRNKKTGEIRDFIINKDKIQTASAIDCWEYDSLSELNEEWEDYEEPKDKEDFWFFDEEGIIRNTKEEYWPEESVASAKKIGNYFETKEEAEKAVEKLKSWKRLKDKGFRFVECYLDNNDDFIIKAKLGYIGLIDQLDVSLLFGCEELWEGK